MKTIRNSVATYERTLDALYARRYEPEVNAGMYAACLRLRMNEKRQKKLREKREQRRLNGKKGAR